MTLDNLRLLRVQYLNRYVRTVQIAEDLQGMTDDIDRQIALLEWNGE